MWLYPKPKKRQHVMTCCRFALAKLVIRYEYSTKMEQIRQQYSTNTDHYVAYICAVLVLFALFGCLQIKHAVTQNRAGQFLPWHIF